MTGCGGIFATSKMFRPFIKGPFSIWLNFSSTFAFFDANGLIFVVGNWPSIE